jgi:ribonucleotide monophosphatase NagD (HAD superfamily)
MGKPHKASWEFIVDRLGGKVDPSRTLMVGDRCVIFLMDYGKNSIKIKIVKKCFELF